MMNLAEQPVPVGLVQTARMAIQQFGVLGTLARYILLRDEVHRFIHAPGLSAADRAARRTLVKRFDAVSTHVPCAHSPHQFILMARYILELDVPGPIVQCGAFKGGSTAKLSLLAELTGRELYVCDSFAGLPAATETDVPMAASSLKGTWEFRQGDYRGALDEVRGNVERWGAIGPCRFVAGWFKDSLPGLDVRPALVFTDVDYVSSVRDCLVNLWPRLQPGGYWFTHEAGFLDYVNGMLDATFWQRELGEPPPVLVGAGVGLSPASPSLGYIAKTRS